MHPCSRRTRPKGGVADRPDPAGPTSLDEPAFEIRVRRVRSNVIDMRLVIGGVHPQPGAQMLDRAANLPAIVVIDRKANDGIVSDFCVTASEGILEATAFTSIAQRDVPESSSPQLAEAEKPEGWCIVPHAVQARAVAVVGDAGADRAA